MDSQLADPFVCRFRTICEVHREIHDIVIEKDRVDEKIIKLLQEAFIMAKKMDNKLRQYKYHYDDGWWEKTTDLEQKLDRRIRRQ